MQEQHLAKEYSKNFYTDKSNSRKELKRMESIEKEVEKNGDWNKFSKAVVDEFIGQTLNIWGK